MQSSVEIGSEMWICISSIQTNKRTFIFIYKINVVINPDPECNTRENESSNEETATEKISWANMVDVYSSLPKFAKSWSCYSAQKVTKLHILQSTFCRNKKNIPSKQKFTRCSTRLVSHIWNLQSYPKVIKPGGV
jgi:hypothetical protein